MHGATRTQAHASVGIPLWTDVWYYVMKLRTGASYDPEILPLVYALKEVLYICISSVYIALLHIIIKKWENFVHSICTKMDKKN